jgi:hypothetical protein
MDLGMKSPTWAVPLAFALVLIAGLAMYFYFQQAQNDGVASQAAAPSVQQFKPKVRQMTLEAAPIGPPLPELASSDKFILDALADLISDRTPMKLLRTDRVIHNIVATIDNLPTHRAPMNVMPVKQAPGKFVTEGSEGALVIGPTNASRYRAYVSFAQSVDAGKLVALYIRLYPLFQQAYEELGYPGKYFNDRLIEALDDLEAAPEITGPVRLAEPRVLYEFADQYLEDRSIGQRIMMRIGTANERIIKEKVREIRGELIRHMHERTLDDGVGR